MGQIVHKLDTLGFLRLVVMEMVVMEILKSRGQELL